MKLVQATEYKLGRIYRLIKPINHTHLQEYGIDVGDMIVIMAATAEFGRWDKRFSTYATKIVKLTEPSVYAPVEQVILCEWALEYFMEVDISCLPDDVHNAYVEALRVNPEYMVENVS